MTPRLEVIPQLQSVLQGIPLMSWSSNMLRSHISGARKEGRTFQMSKRARRTYESN